MVWCGVVCCAVLHCTACRCSGRWTGVGDVTPLGRPLQPGSSRSLYSWRRELVEAAPRDAARRGGGSGGKGVGGGGGETQRGIRKRQTETGPGGAGKDPARRRYRLLRHRERFISYDSASCANLLFSTLKTARLQFYSARCEKCTLPSDTLLKRYFTTSTMLRRVTETAAGARSRSRDIIGNLSAFPAFATGVPPVTTPGRRLGGNGATIRHSDTIGQRSAYDLRASPRPRDVAEDRRVSEINGTNAVTYPDNGVQFGHGDLLRPLDGSGHLLLMLQCHAIIIASSSHSIVRSRGTRAKQKVEDLPLAPETEALARLLRSAAWRSPSANT
ncbi:hypothetical protein X777_13410 [Ooceraea biroi]|uniref:Uncharacterized protein n=1 Tax=Ooceraea biroi TaxID=2015173 RepID=A0A026WX50_OOCBI|nr:hypothetical protein X777_13410 [Ooceraea biroi]